MLCGVRVRIIQNVTFELTQVLIKLIVDVALEIVNKKQRAKCKKLTKNRKKVFFQSKKRPKLEQETKNRKYFNYNGRNVKIAQNVSII